MKKINEFRKPDYSINDFFYERWSPRALTGEKIPDEVLNKIFEAARWAPSCFNEQPWRFLYARKDSGDWSLFLSLLVDMNQVWAKNASALIVCISKKNFTRNGNPNRTHSFDVGSAWQNLALQAHLLGWAAHGMAGVHYERAAKELNVPADYNVEMMIAVGKLADISALPEDFQKKEWPPSGRKKIGEFTAIGKWPDKPF